MSYNKVVMILNITDYGIIKEPLKQLNLPGISVSYVEGFGDYVNDFSENSFSEGMKIEVYTTSEQADEIGSILSKLANDITDGGGVVAIEPVIKLMNVRKIMK